MHTEEIKNLIEAKLPDSQVLIDGDGTHFNAIVISRSFIGKSRVQKQQLVYNAVNSQLADGSLHALSLRTFTPEEWEKLETQKG